MPLHSLCKDLLEASQNCSWRCSRRPGNRHARDASRLPRFDHSNREMIVIEVLCKESIIPSSLKLSSVLCGAKCLLLRATSTCHQSAQSVIGLFCHDIDNAIHRVSAPYRGSRPADHFNPVNIL